MPFLRQHLILVLVVLLLELVVERVLLQVELKLPKRLVQRLRQIRIGIIRSVRRVDVLLRLVDMILRDAGLFSAQLRQLRKLRRPHVPVEAEVGATRGCADENNRKLDQLLLERSRRLAQFRRARAHAVLQNTVVISISCGV